MSLKRVWLAIVIAGAPLALFEGCSFPDVTYFDGPGEAGGGESGVDDASNLPSDAGVDADGGRQRPPDVDPEGGAGDAATRSDATIERPEAGVDAGALGCAGAGGEPCDCDSDDALNGGPGCKPPVGERADCDDFDPLVDPGVGFVRATWDPRSPHLPVNDWNCDGTVTKQFDYGIKCSLTDCTQGFAEDIPCGATGTYNICKPSLSVIGLLTFCSVGSTESRVQGCR